MGGGEIIASFLDAQAIDEFVDQRGPGLHRRRHPADRPASPPRAAGPARVRTLRGRPGPTALPRAEQAFVMTRSAQDWPAPAAITIDYLDQHLEAIPGLAQWHHDEWSSITPDLTIDDRIQGFRARARRGGAPSAVVAVVDGHVAGLACLVAADIDSHAHLTPWLASVLVGWSTGAVASVMVGGANRIRGPRALGARALPVHLRQAIHVRAARLASRRGRRSREPVRCRHGPYTGWL